MALFEKGAMTWKDRKDRIFNKKEPRQIQDRQPQQRHGKNEVDLTTIEDARLERSNLVADLEKDIQESRNEKTELRRVIANQNNSIGQLSSKLESEEAENAHLVRGLKSKAEHLNIAQEEADRLNRLNADCIRRINQLKQGLTEKEEELVKFEQNKVHERSKHAETVAALHQKMAQLTGEHEQTLAQLIGEHEGTVAQMKADLAQVTEGEGKKRQKLKVLHDQQMTQINQEHEQTISRVNEELAQVIQNEGLKISQLKEACAAKLAQKDLDYAQGTRQLREDVRKLNAALLTRDDQLYQGELFTTPNLPTRPDEQIQGKFSEIEQMVDSLGRLQWKQEPAVWTREVLQAIGGNRVDRVLKKAIVQDLIWCLLFSHIFCSPFRVFGAEGRLLEKEWNEQCGHHGDSKNEVFSWPVPNAKTERWRYMTVKECREVLRPPVPSDWDPRMRLRKGFMDNLRESMSELKASLEKIADLTLTDMQMIDRLPKKAATIWLDFSIHRCRIVFHLKHSTALSMEEKVAIAQNSSLELTVIPVVGRYGNVKGADLDMYTIIDPYAGESIILSS